MASGSVPVPSLMFLLRDYDKRDFESLFKLDRLCFEPGIAYSRPELASFIEQRRSITIVGEWQQAANGQLPPDQPSPDAEAPSPSQLQSQSRPQSQPQPRLNAPRRPVAGFITFHFERQGYGHVITIDVHPEARRHGLGTLLLDATCERLHRMTAFMLVLEVAVNNHAALAFYEKIGFKRIKVLERYYSRELDAIQMIKRL
jgi:[ribosomal protein S18]-alanine N-acetyltransferase